MDQEELQKLKNLKGEIKGAVFQTDATHVSKTMGKEAVAKLQQASKELGWEIDYPNIKFMTWYPIGMKIISLLAAQKAFGWGEKELFEMNASAPKYTSFVSRILKYFVSLKGLFRQMPKYWKMHFSVGRLEPEEYDPKQNLAVVKLKDFDIHPLFCLVIRSYILSIIRFAIKSKKIIIEETKCVHKGDPYHEFSIKWE